MLNNFSHSQFFIALCALLFGAESYIISGIPADPKVLAIIFFATLFVYNASLLKIAIFYNNSDSQRSVTFSGNKSHIVWCSISIMMVFSLLAASHFFNIIIFITTAIFSIFYMMPFTKNGLPLKGIRNHLILKNILLSLIWASATVLFPLADEQVFAKENSLLFLRHFFFIYALTVVYDIRDINADNRSGLKTLAIRFGESGARKIALISLALFVFSTAIDPLMHFNIAIALYLSAIYAALVIINTRQSRSVQYYSYMVDGAIVLQFLLIFFFNSQIH